MPLVKYRLIGRGLPPRPTEMPLPGWAGVAQPRAEGSREQPWHCIPFSEGARYGLELVYPFETELRVETQGGRLVLSADFAPDPDDEHLMWPPFRNFGDRFYTYQLALDLKPPKGWAIRVETHPRFYTDLAGETPIAVPALIRAAWWPMVFFLVFKSPPEGTVHVFRPGEPFAQVLIVPEEPGLELVEMVGDEAAERELQARRVRDSRDDLAEASRWVSTSEIEFDGTYRHMLRAAKARDRGA